uniref:Myristoylated alanine-rich C-kinase substrate n=2 Tax=Gasterosteus aculeatus TaxID=69293 RepID=G3NSQ5_GASAC
MGAQLSRAAVKAEAVAEKPGEAVASSPNKTNGQENGHVKVNGDTAAENGKEEVQANGSAAAEDSPKEEDAPAEKEATDGEKVEAASPAPAEGEVAKVEEGTAATPSASNETPKKKKKRFSFKKSFKLSGFSFKKTKKETGDGAEGEEVAAADDAVAAASTEEPKAEGTE